MYFHSDGLLSPLIPDANAPPRSFVFDPAHPVPSLGGSLCAIMELPAESAGGPEAMWSRFLNPVLRLRNVLGPGPMDQRETAATFGAAPPFRRLRDRADVLVFQTPPLAHGIEVTGEIVVHLHVASTAPDTDFTAKLIDVHPPIATDPDGYEMNLCDSIIRCRFREGWDREVFMQHGNVYAVTISLPPTSNFFAPGHRIRIDLSSSNFPRLDVNPNTGEPIGKHTRLQTATNTVFVDAARPSRVILPLLPPEAP